MDSAGTKINDILDENKRLSNEESSMVDSIINDLNTNQKQPITSQEKLPQISNEEKELLMRQRAQYEQQRQQQQRQQHMIQQQQQQQMMEAYAKQMKDNKDKDKQFLEKVKGELVNSIDVIIVTILSIVFNIDVFSDFLSFKSVPFFYDISKGKPTVWAIVLKGVIIGLTYYLIKYFIK